MIARAYIRVSTVEQADSRLGLEAQSFSIREACERRGFDLVDTYEDAGFSGGSLRRPAVERLLGDVRPGEAVVVAKLCRISRSLMDFAGLVERSKREGWSLVVLDPDLDLSTANGRLVANVLAAVVEWERDIIGQRTCEALAAKRARGERLGAEPVVVGALADRIRVMRAGGESLRSICGVLNAEGVPTPRGGRVWRPSSLEGVLARG